MKKITSKFVAVLLALSLLITGMPARTFAATTAEPKSADEVVYVKSGKYVYNWGKRGTVATFLTTYAEDYYTGSYAYDNLAGLAGSNVAGTAFYSSALGTAIHNLLVAKQTSTTSYDQVKTLLKYTESQQSNTTKLTTFYTAQEISNVWDGGATWNREHTWPNSKGLNGQDEDDVLMLKPENSSDNSSRGNTAYGEGTYVIQNKEYTYFNPNKAAGQNLHGDVARLLLQHLMRWGNTAKFYGYDGVIESRAVLLKWLAEDPVDTWEMGRNDAVQSITGIRNIFVDYPELAFKLLGEDVPDGYITPSGSESVNYTITVLVNNAAYGTASVNGRTITAVPASGYYVKSASVTNGTGTTSVDGNTIRVSASSDCTVTVNFAPITYATLTYVINGETFNTLSVQTGTKVTLPTVSASAFAGYSFLGWATEEMTDALTKPTLYTTEYTPTADTTLYAVFSRMEEGGSTAVSQFVLVKDMSQLTIGAEVIIAAADSDYALGNESVSSKAYKNISVLKEGETLQNVDESSVAILSLGSGLPSGTWSFYNSVLEGYLAPVKLPDREDGTPNKNTLQIEDALSNNSSFTISLANGIATIQSSTSLGWSYIKYNTDSPRFSCYALDSSSTADVALYVKTGAFTTFYTTNPGADLEYTVTAVSNDTAKGTVSVVGYSVVCEPADGYEVAEVSVTSGTATWKLDGSIITVTPASDCEITVTFAESQSGSLVDELHNGDRIVISVGGTVLTSTVSGKAFQAATPAFSGGKLVQEDTYMVLTVEETANGLRFKTADGKYLTSGATGNGLTLEATANDYSLWALEQKGSDIVVKNQNAAYNGNSQYLEAYNNNITTYGYSTANADKFPVQFYLVDSSTPTPPEPETARITYVVNGVTATSGDFAVGTTVTLAEPSTSFEGYTYVGWSTAEIETPAATADVLLQHTVTADATLYALFISNTTGTYTTRPAVAPPISYKVTYVANGKAMGSQSAAGGSSLKLLTVVPSVTNYKLAGWSTSEITSEVTSVASLLTGSYTPTADVTLYAVYQNKTTNGYTTVPGSETAGGTIRVTLMVDGKQATAGDFEIGSTVTLAEPSESFEGFTYAGWVSSEIPTEVSDEPAIITSFTAVTDCTLYAVFKSTYTNAYTTAPKMNHLVLSTSTPHVKRGQEFTVIVSSQGVVPFTSASFSAGRGEEGYDYDNFQLISSRPLTATASLKDCNRGDCVASWTAAGAYEEDLFEITFKVRDTAELGEYTFSGISLAANDDKRVTVSTVALTVTVSDIIPGDLNEDGKVTDADAIYLLYYTFYPDDYPLNQPADFNGDGKITDADAIYLLYYTFYPEDYPLE